MGARLAKIKKKVDKIITDINPLYGMPEIDESVVVDNSFGPIRMVGREAWGAKEPKWVQKLPTPVSMYVLRYFSDTRPCYNDIECFRALRVMQDTHMAWGMPDIAYNFLIGNDGTIYEGRGWTAKPTNQDWDYDKYDGQSLSICLIGEYRDIWPPDEMKEAVCRLMREGLRLGYSSEGWDLTEIRLTAPHLYKEMIEKSNNLPGERFYNERIPTPIEQTFQKPLVEAAKKPMEKPKFIRK